MFAAFGGFAARNRRWVLIGALLFLVLGGVWGSGAGSVLGGGAGLDAPERESSQADRILEGTLGRYTADVVVMYESADMTVDDPRFRQEIEQVANALPAETYTRLETFWSTGNTDFVSSDRHKTYMALQLPGEIEEERVLVYDEIKDSFDAPSLTERLGGLVAVNEQFNRISTEGIARAEMISFPLLLLLLVLVFRSVIAASLPLAIAVLVAVGSLAVLRVVGAFTDLSTISINVVVVLGLGLATDYALLIVNRFREELDHGLSVDDAVARAMATAGRTVVVSGLTVAVTLGGLLVFTSRFLQSLAYSGVSVVLFAVLSAVLVLPALLRVTGHRVNSWRIPLPVLHRRTAVAGGRWYRTAHAVMRRPMLSTLAITFLLILLGLPALGVNLARPAEWALQPGTDSLVVTEELERDFPADPTKVITAVVRIPSPADSPQAQAQLTEFAGRLDQIDGVRSAAVTGTEGNLARITLGYSLSPYGEEIREVVRALRATPPPPGATAMFTNRPAAIVDMLDMLGERLPWMILIIVVVSFVLLFLAFGSVALPIKSVLMNLLSLSATFGAITLIFQYGWLEGLLDFEAPGFLDANMPMMMAVVAFGLAMDYEVFMLARIREEYLKSGDPVESVAVGVQHTARLITSAALLLAVVLAGFAFTDITVLKMVGVGLVFAIFVDATIVRGLLVPSTMRLLGHWAWWAPGPMARWWKKYGLPEESGSTSETSQHVAMVSAGGRQQHAPSPQGPVG